MPRSANSASYGAVWRFFARSAPTTTPARPSAAAAASRPSWTPRYSRSPASAGTTSPRWPRSPRTAPPSPGTSDPPQPNRQPGPEDPANRVSPSMLAPNPSQHLESETQLAGNPLFTIQPYAIVL